MFFTKGRQACDKGPLTEHEYELLQKARQLIPSNPPNPWGNRRIISAAGAIAGGWTKNEHYVLISSSGYSLNNPLTGERIERNRDSGQTLESLSEDSLHFTLPSSNETVSIYGLDAGDGIRVSPDGWLIERIAPWWPREAFMIKNVYVPHAAKKGYLDDAAVLDIPRLDGWMRAGFSPSGKYLAVLGSGGAVLFTNGDK